MRQKSHQDIPAEVEKVYRRLERWREKRRGRSPIPNRLWTAAGAVARVHGVNRTSKVLHLEFKKLKSFAESEAPIQRKAPPRLQFMELMTTSPTGASECVIELEAGHRKMRVHWKGMTATDLAQFSRMILGQA